MPPASGYVVVRNDTYRALATSKKLNVSCVLWSAYREEAQVFRDYDSASDVARGYEGAKVFPANQSVITFRDKQSAVYAAKEKQMSKEKNSESKSKRPTLYGTSLYKVGKWMGNQGYSATQFKKLLTYHGHTLSDTSIPTAISDGKRPDKWGPLPEMSAKDAAEIAKIVGAPGSDKKPKEEPKKKSAPAAAPAKKKVAAKKKSAPAAAPAKKKVAAKKKSAPAAAAAAASPTKKKVAAKKKSA